MDPILKIVSYVFKQNGFDNNDSTYESFFLNGVAFPKFVAISFNVDKIPGIKPNPTNQFQKNINNSAALQYACANNPIISKISPNYDNDKCRSFLLSLILKNQTFKINIDQIINQCNAIVQKLGIKYSKKTDILNGNCIISLLNVLTDGKVTIETNIIDFNQTMKKCLELANVPFVIDETSLSNQNQFTFHIQLLIIFDIYSEKIKKLQVDSNKTNSMEQKFSAEKQSISKDSIINITKQKESQTLSSQIKNKPAANVANPQSKKISELDESSMIIQPVKSTIPVKVAKTDQEKDSKLDKLASSIKPAKENNPIIPMINQSKSITITTPESSMKTTVSKLNAKEHAKSQKTITQSENSPETTKDETNESNDQKSKHHHKEKNDKDHLEDSNIKKKHNHKEKNEGKESKDDKNGTKVEQLDIDNDDYDDIEEDDNEEDFVDFEDIPFVDPKDYKIIKDLGQGNFGYVKLVENIKTGKLYAAKISKNEFCFNFPKKQFYMEIKSQITAKNPAVLNLIGISFNDFDGNDYPTIIIDFLPNKSLQNHLNDEYKSMASYGFTSSKKYIILLGIALGMKHLHFSGIVHRDLKPENILLDDNFYPYICDFGLSVVNDYFSNISGSQLNQECGTRIYMAPEIHANQPYSYKVDVYSFALIMYELLTGRPPYENMDFFLFIASIAQGKRPSLSDIKDECICSFLNKCWNENPNLRPTFNEIVNELMQERYIKYFDADMDEVEEYLDLFDDSLKTYNSNSDVASAIKKLADEGDPRAMFNYGYLLLNGNDVKSNINEGIRYIKLAADNKFIYAMNIYGTFCGLGFHTPRDFQASARYFRSSAKRKDPNGLTLYGSSLKDGVGVQKNVPKGIKYIKLASNKGMAKASYIYGRMLYNGEDIPVDLEEAAYYIKRAADQIDPDACLLYGSMFENGKGVPVDTEKAAYYYRIADEHGNKNALLALGMLYFKSIDSLKKKEGLIYMSKAAEKGNTDAMVEMGIACCTGEGFVKNKHSGLNYFKKAADLGNSFGMFNYAKMLYYGDEVPKNVEKAIEYFQKSIKLGNTCSMLELGIIYYNTSRKDEGLKLVKMSMENGNELAKQKYPIMLNEILSIKENADKGDTDAMFEYALMLLNGDGVPANIKESLNYFKMAADKGDTTAAYNYGYLILKNNGDEKEYLKYLKMAADKEFPKALQLYGNILMNDPSPSVKFSAAPYLKKAADLGLPHAMYLYGSLLLEDESLAHITEAIEYLQMACQNGISQAREKFTQYYYKFLTCSLIQYVDEGDMDNISQTLSNVGFGFNKKEIVQYILLAIEKGSNDAMLFYADMLFTGDGIEMNKKEAIRYYEMSANYGNQKAMLTLGKILYNGDVYPSNKKKAACIYKKCADKGDVEAMFLYAEMLFNGIEIPVNRKEAIKYYIMSSQNEYVEAMVKVGKLLYKGEDLPQDRKKAAELYCMCAEKGNAEAMFLYAEMLLNGIEIPVNKDDAIKLYKKSADNGNIDAMLAYAKMKDNCFNNNEASYYYRMSINNGNTDAILPFADSIANQIDKFQNIQLNLPYLKLAADKGHAKAMYIYGLVLSTKKIIPKDLKEAFKYIKMAADKGEESAILECAKRLHDGYGVDVNKKEAAKYYQIGASTEGSIELFEYAQILYNGDGVPEDKEKAAELFKKAAEKGNTDAMKKYGEMLFYGDGIKMDKVEGDKYKKKAEEYKKSNEDSLLNAKAIASFFFGDNPLSKVFNNLF